SFLFQQPDEWAWAALLSSPIFVQFSYQGIWERNHCGSNEFDAAGPPYKR
ncbi:unnamed protein product, partial [Prunus brigantina]